MIVDVGEPNLLEFSINIPELLFGKCLPKFLPIQHGGFLTKGVVVFANLCYVEITTYVVHVLNQDIGEGVQVLEEHFGVVFCMAIVHGFYPLLKNLQLGNKVRVLFLAS